MISVIKSCKRFGENVLNCFLKVNAFQNYVNSHTTDTKFGMSFVVSGENATIEQVFGDYYFYDIQKDDIVLDIGANVGTFGMFLAKQGVKRVYAIEPITTNILRRNIRCNNLNNIEVIDACLGDGKINIEWSGKSQYRDGLSLSKIINRCGGHIDFLKIDCEGGEWCIKLKELKGIRRIEGEVHNFDGKHEFSTFLAMLDMAGFVYEYNIRNETVMLFHATASWKS